MFIATPLDHTSKNTKNKPTAPILGRLLALAKASLGLLTNRIDSLQIAREMPDFKASNKYLAIGIKDTVQCKIFKGYKYCGF